MWQISHFILNVSKKTALKSSFHNQTCITGMYISINSLPHMPILGSSNSAANKDVMSKVLTNSDTTI